MPRRLLLLLTLIGIILLIWYLNALRPSKRSQLLVGANTSAQNAINNSALYHRAPELAGIAGYLNTDRITLGELIGKKIVLVDFWTYSCINCQRTTPYLNAWYDKYHDDGLEIIGVHTPEFSFEKKYDNVALAIKKFGIRYPVVQDNDYATWNAYHNRYWPRKYLINLDGQIVYDHIGEGGYEETERTIQKLLAESRQKIGLSGQLADKIISEERTFPSLFPPSPETYFGAARNAFLANGEAALPGEQILSLPNAFKVNKLYLGGKWAFNGEFAQNVTPGAKIVLRYRAKEVYMVASADQEVKIGVQRDGQPLGNVSGADVTVLPSGPSEFTVKEDRLYKIVQDQNFGEHVLEFTVQSPNVRFFTFTFGS